MDKLIRFLWEGNSNVGVIGSSSCQLLEFSDKKFWLKIVENGSESIQNKPFIIFVTAHNNEWTMVLLDKYNSNLYFYYTSSDVNDKDLEFQNIYQEIAETCVGVHVVGVHVKRISKDVYGQGECGLVILWLLKKILERGEPEALFDGISSLEISSIGFQCLKHISLLPIVYSKMST
jgi:hypothetical protein